MKRIGFRMLTALLCLCMVLSFTACGGASTSSDTGDAVSAETTTTKPAKATKTTAATTSTVARTTTTQKKITTTTKKQTTTTTAAVATDTIYRNLGKPHESGYLLGSVTYNVWDLEEYHGKIFCGEGDYGLNTGPVSIWAYDIEGENWIETDVLNEEAINRFFIIDGNLMTVGVDPRDNWEFGNYYIYREDVEGGRWELFRNIPGGVHVFDMVKHDGKLFVGLGTLQGVYPIAVSEDGGLTFTEVMMMRNGELVSMFISNGPYRVYDFFTLGDDLYATYSDGRSQDIYHYEDGMFVYMSSNYNYIPSGDITQVVLGGKVTFKEKLYIANSYLCESSDVKTFTEIVLPGMEEEYYRVSDLYVKDDVLYVLCAYLSDTGDWMTTVWQNKTGKPKDFKKLFEFPYEAPPLSLVCVDNDVYIGMGDKNVPYETNGDLLLVENGLRGKK